MWNSSHAKAIGRINPFKNEQLICHGNPAKQDIKSNRHGVSCLHCDPTLKAKCAGNENLMKLHSLNTKKMIWASTRPCTNQDRTGWTSLNQVNSLKQVWSLCRLCPSCTSRAKSHKHRTLSRNRTPVTLSAPCGNCTQGPLARTAGILAGAAWALALRPHYADVVFLLTNAPCLIAVQSQENGNSDSWTGMIVAVAIHRVHLLLSKIQIASTVSLDFWSAACICEDLSSVSCHCTCQQSGSKWAISHTLVVVQNIGWTAVTTSREAPCLSYACPSASEAISSVPEQCQTQIKSCSHSGGLDKPKSVMSIKDWLIFMDFP